MTEKELGKITHFFSKISVAVLEITAGELKAGEKIHVKGPTTDFIQPVDSMQMEHKDVPTAKKGQSIGLKTREPVKQGDVAYKVVEQTKQKI